MESREKEAQEWSDDIPEDENHTAYEETYWDGSTKNECWAEE